MNILFHFYSKYHGSETACHEFNFARFLLCFKKYLRFSLLG